MTAEDDQNQEWIRLGYSPELAESLRAYFRAERRRLKRGIGAIQNPMQRAARNRYANRQVRKLIKLARGPRARRPSVPMLISRYKPSEILDSMLPGREQMWLPIAKRFHTKPVLLNLSHFSFVDNAIETMRMLHKIAELECTAIDGTLNFLDQNCLDIGPYVILQSAWDQMCPLFRSGAITGGLQQVIESVGLREVLHIAPFRNRTDSGNISPFKLQRRRAAGTSKSKKRYLDPQKYEMVADDLVRWIDSWLGDILGQQLSINGRRIVQKIIGEVLDNAERHSDIHSRDGDWAIAGCLRQEQVGGQERYLCQLSFLSVGATIAESMKTCAPPHGGKNGRVCFKAWGQERFL